MPAITTLQIRRGTAAAWTSANPTLSAGEPGYETDTHKFKVGDGSTAWASLPYTYYPSSPTDGWLDDSAEAWVYASADSPTFTFTVNADVTDKYAPGQRIKLTQTTVKYFIITAVSSYSGGFTTITVYGGTDYTLANAAISAQAHSLMKAPFGFPLNPSKWTVEVIPASSSYIKTTATQNTWYGDTALSPTGPKIDVPIGLWELSYFAYKILFVSSGGTLQVLSTLSKSSSAEDDDSFTSQEEGSSQTSVGGTSYCKKIVSVSSKTSYYLLIMGVNSSGGTLFELLLGNAVGTGIIALRAVCAYL